MALTFRGWDYKTTLRLWATFVFSPFVCRRGWNECMTPAQPVDGGAAGPTAEELSGDAGIAEQASIGLSHHGCLVRMWRPDKMMTERNPLPVVITGPLK